MGQKGFIIICLLLSWIWMDGAASQNQSRTPSISQTAEHYIETSSIIFGLSRIASKTDLSEQCFNQLKSIESGILKREPWAMKVLDSSGAVQSEFIWGHNYWLGSREACAAVQNPVQITLSNRLNRTMKDGLVDQAAPFEMDYRVLYVTHNSPWQVEFKVMNERIIHLGLCLPSACSCSEIQAITQFLLDKNIFGNIYDLRPQVQYVKDLKLKESFFQRTSLKIMAGVLIFTLAMIVLAGYLRTYKKDVPKVFSGWVTFIKCFDIVENFRGLFTINESTPNSIPLINGLRSVSCLWVIIPHVPLYMFFAMSNKVFFFSYTEMVIFQYIAKAPLLVDLFFAVSGFVQTHFFMKNEQLLDVIRKSTLPKIVQVWGKLMVRAYLRFAPLYLVVMAAVDIFTAYAADVSVFQIHPRYDQICSNYWWRNVLFIQNLFNMDEMCLNWTWSLACEMQFYSLIFLFLFIYAKHPRAFRNILISTILVSITWAYHTGLKSQYQLSIDIVYLTRTEFYINPFVRVTPYLMGSMTSWWLAQKKGQFQMGRIVEKCVWHLAILVFFACILFTINLDIPPLQAVSVVVFGRILFTMCVCWMIIGSATGSGVWWSRFLENNLFQHFSRVSYAIYLLNPLVIASIFSLSQTSYRLDILQTTVMTIGIAVIVYVLAVVFSLAFEMPYCNLSRALTKTSVKLKDT